MLFEYFIGLDMASQTFVATVLAKSLHLVLAAKTFSNDPDGWEAFVVWLTNAKIERHTAVICLEATGVYSEALCYYLQAQEWWLAVHPPLEIKRAFAPVGHKTDTVDSRQIAEYAVRFTDKLRRWHPKKDLLEQIQVLLHTREQFVRQRTADKNTLRALQRKGGRTPLAEDLYQEHIHQLTKNIQALEHEIRKLLEQDHDLHTQALMLMTVPGVGLL